MKNIVIFLLTLFIYGCAVNPIRLAPQSFTSENQTGIIAGTISIIDGSPKFNSYDFFYREIGQKKESRISIQPDQGGFTLVLKPDYKIGDTLVFQYVMEHPPGNYEFINYSLFTNLGYFQSTKYDRKGISIAFSVKKGEIAYLGDMVINTKEFKQTGTLIRWLDHSTREHSRFKRKFKNIDWSLFSNKTIEKGEIEDKKLIIFVNDKKEYFDEK